MVGACEADVAVIATDTRLSRQTASGREVVRDDETKLRYSGKGWYAGAGYARAIDLSLEVLRVAPIADTDDVRRILVMGRELLLEPLKREHPEHAAMIDGTSMMLTLRDPSGPVVMMFAPVLLGDKLGILRPGKLYMIPPIDLAPGVVQDITAEAGTYSIGSPTQEERIAAVATAVARSAAAVVARSAEVSDRLDIGIHRISQSSGSAALLRLHGRSVELAGCKTFDDLMRFYVRPE